MYEDQTRNFDSESSFINNMDNVSVSKNTNKNYYDGCTNKNFDFNTPDFDPRKHRLKHGIYTYKYKT